MFFFFFFFQAEDGIRDWSVTGVQTCALPISHRRGAVDAWHVHSTGRERVGLRGPTGRDEPGDRRAAGELRRSEERRVGKECRSRGAAGDLKKKVEADRRKERSKVQ